MSVVRTFGAKASCGANKHDQATILICACIVEDINTKSSIVGTLSKVGLNPRHVAIILEKETGNDPQRHRWLRDAEGRYRLLEDA